MKIYVVFRDFEDGPDILTFKGTPLLYRDTTESKLVRRIHRLAKDIALQTGAPARIVEFISTGTEVVYKST